MSVQTTETKTLFPHEERGQAFHFVCVWARKGRGGGRRAQKNTIVQSPLFFPFFGTCETHFWDSPSRSWPFLFVGVVLWGAGGLCFFTKLYRRQRTVIWELWWRYWERKPTWTCSAIMRYWKGGRSVTIKTKMSRTLQEKLPYTISYPRDFYTRKINTFFIL